MRQKITALAVGAVAVAGGVPAGASAAEPGFTVDPQSPAGVEYQVPLDSARGQGGSGSGHHGGNLGGSNGGGGGSNGGGGATTGGGSSPGTSSSSLFGTGITPSTANGSRSGGSPGGGNAGAGRSGGHGSGGPAAGGSDARHLPSLTTTADYSSTGPLAGIIAAIVITGGAFGLFLRLRARGPRKIFS